MTARYLDQFENFLRSDTAMASEPANDRRRTAMKRFATLGFPTTKNEDWHFTSIAPIVEREFTFVATRTGHVTRADLEAFGFGADDKWHTAVFVNSRFAPELSSLSRLDPGVRVLSLHAAWKEAPELAMHVGTIVSDLEHHTFTALNTAFMPDGAVLHVPKEVVVRKPIHLLFITDAHAAKTVMYPRNLIVVDRSARATVLESYVSLGDAAYFTNAVTEVGVAEGATLTHYKVQR